jgi:hypothetical protein
MRAVLAVALAVSAPGIALAQSDFDQRWVERSIATQRLTDPKPKPRPAPRRRIEAPKRVYSVAPSTAPRDAPSISGIETRGTQRIERDVLSNVSCLPALSAISPEYVSEDAAWRNAQLAWENLVRWRYGERVAAIANAAEVVKRCSRSSFPQSVVGRAIERVTESVGVDGFKTRCEVSARPCMAPAEVHPTRKGD